jgi:hypothetical protein
LSLAGEKLELNFVLNYCKVTRQDEGSMYASDAAMFW